MNEKSPVGSTVIFITSPCNTVLNNDERQGLNLMCPLALSLTSS